MYVSIKIKRYYQRRRPIQTNNQSRSEHQQYQEERTISEDQIDLSVDREKRPKIYSVKPKYSKNKKYLVS